MKIQAVRESPRNVESPLQPLQWVNNYSDYLFAFAMTRVQNEDQARDLVQETFLAGLEKRQCFENRCTEKTWLTSILKNKICDLYLRLSKYPAAEKIPAEPFFREMDGHWNPQYRPIEFGNGHHFNIETKEFHKVLSNCIKKLPANWMLVFSMKHLEDCDTTTICEELNLTPSNFWVIIHRAKLKLRACLQRNL